MSPSKTSPQPLIDIHIQMKNGFDEIGLINGNFQEVGRGLGSLNASVEPGFYKVRQQVGDLEKSQIIEVSADTNGNFEFNTLAFDSALPRQGPESPVPEQEALMREPAPYSDGQPPPVQVFLWDAHPTSDESNVETRPGPQVLEQFLLRAFKGEVVYNFSQITPMEDAKGVLFVNIQVPVGVYLLVQPGLQTEHCMPLHVLENWAPQIYFRVARTPDGIMLPLDFNHASITYATHGKVLLTQELTLLEVARKALARGRVVNFSGLGADLANNNYKDPVLHLIGAHLLLLAARSKAPRSLDQLENIIESLVISLGPDFPDVIALQAGLADVQKATPVLPTNLTSPPMLKRSWDLLLHAYRDSTVLSEVMDFSYMVEPTSTWFVWSGQPLETPVEATMRNLRESLIARITPTFVLGMQRLVKWIDRDPPDVQIKKLPEAVGINAVPLIKSILEDERLINWIQLLLDRTEQDPALKDPLDKALLQTLCSAQTLYFSKRKGSESVAQDIVQSFNVPAPDLARSAMRILSSMVKAGYVELPKLMEIVEESSTRHV